jgi:hypothetical protein
MSEAEFDLLLDAVRTAVASSPEDFMVAPSTFAFTAEAANDNHETSRQENWDLIPFPEGWNAVC